MPLEGTGIKLACRYFQECAGVFNELTQLTGSISADELTPDLSRESLIMNSNLCLAQAQYLYYRKASEFGRDDLLLSKLSA